MCNPQWLCGLLIVVQAVALPAVAEIVGLHGCETEGGATVTWGAQVEEGAIDVVTDKQYVTEGAGCLHLSGVVAPESKGNTYLGMKLPVEKTDLREKTILLDAWTSTPAMTNALYVRLYNAAGEKVGSWSNWGSPFIAGTRQTFKVHKLVSTAGLTFEQHEVEGREPAEVVAVEIIIGTHEKAGRFDLYVDNLRYDTEPLRSMQAVTEPKQLCLDTVLADHGKPNAVIVHPDDAEHAAAAQALVDAIRSASGVSVPLATTPPAAGTNLLLLGNLNNNPAIAPLYGLALCSADAVFPGTGGYVLRTIHDPWGAGKNAVLLGGSDAAGVSRAVEEFAKLLKPGKRLVVPRTYKLAPGQALEQRLPWLSTPPPADHVAERLAAADEALARGAHTGLFGMIAAEGERYLWTGFEPYAEAFVKLVVKAHEHYLTKPSTYGGPWGMDSDFTAYRVFPGWEVVEESPSITDDERLQVTKILAQWIAEAVAPKTPGLSRSERVRHNHQTFPALGCFFAGAYLEKSYNVVEGPHWSALARACFEVQSKSFKSMEDCNGYQWLTLGHTIHYATSSGDYSYFENENARRNADYALLCMDNLGYQVPYGDTGSFKCWFSELPFLRRAAWYYDSLGQGEMKNWAAGYQWALEKKAQVADTLKLNQYARPVPPARPERLVGVHAWPVAPMYYKTMGADPRPPVEKCLDKVVMRAGFDPEDEYLLLDGLSNGGHKHYDGNTISRITQGGRIWLADNDYYKSQPKFHNGVLIFKDGQSQTIPAYCELEYAAGLPSAGFSRTVVRDYAGVDWHRSIVWEKGRHFTVFDELVAKEADDYSFHAKWHAVGKPELRDDGLAVTQQGRQFFLKHGADVRLKLTDDRNLGANWAGYEYADPIVRVLTQIADTKLDAGESAVLPTILFGRVEGAGDDLAVRRLPNGAVVLGEGEEATLVDARVLGLGDPRQPLALDAQAYLLSQEKLCAFGARALTVGGQAVLTATAPVDFELALTDLTGTLHVPEDCKVNWAWADKARVFFDGEPVPNAEEFEVEAGTHEVRVERATPSPLRRALAVTIAPATKPRSLPAASLQPQERAPLSLRGTFRETFSEYLLTNNAGYFESVDVGAQVEVSPPPRAANWFGDRAASARGDSNKASNLTDGVFLQTDGCVQWDDDQVVTVSIDLGKPYDLTHVRLKQWWADASSKGKTFQLDRAVLLLSNDGVWNDGRETGEIVDREEHGNWGAPGYGPVAYDFEDLGQQARFVQLKLTPKKGTAIYLSEVEVWGQGDELEVSAEEARKRGLPVHTFPALFTADVDGDGSDEVIAGSTNGSVSLLDEGERKWKFDTEQPVYAVTAADLDGDGEREVLTGGADQTVHCLDANGQELWQAKLPRYKNTPVVRVLFTAKLSKGKARAVIAGADSWRYYAFDHTGKELWHCESVHRSTAGTTVDLERDGIDEVFCGTEYYWWPCVRADGSQAWSYSTRTGPKANSVASGDIDGDGKEEVVVGGADANLHALDHDGKLMWQYNTGDEVTSVLCVDLDGDGADEILAGSSSFNVYALKGNGTRLWRRGMGDEVTALTLTGDSRRPVAAGTASGRLGLLSGAGTLLAVADVGAPILALTAGRATRHEVTVSAADGTLRAYSLPSQ